MNVHTWTRVYACVTRELNDCVALECNGLKAFFSWILYLLESCMIGVPSIFFKFSIHIHMWFLLLLLVSANRASVQACVCLCICVWVIKQKHVNRNSWLNKFKKKPYLHAWRDQKKEKHSYKSSISNEWVLSVCVCEWVIPHVNEACHFFESSLYYKSFALRACCRQTISNLWRNAWNKRNLRLVKGAKKFAARVQRGFPTRWRRVVGWALDLFRKRGQFL